MDLKLKLKKFSLAIYSCEDHGTTRRYRGFLKERSKEK